MSEVDKLKTNEIPAEQLGEGLESENNQNPESAISSLEKEVKDNKDPEAAIKAVEQSIKKTELKEVKLTALGQFNEDIYNIIIDEEILNHLVGIDKNHAASIHKFKADFLKFIEKEFYENQQDKKLDQRGMAELLLKEFASHIGKAAWPYFKQKFFTKYNNIVDYLENLDKQSKK